jgi:hypothetical protein
VWQKGITEAEEIYTVSQIMEVDNVTGRLTTGENRALMEAFEPTQGSAQA